MTKSLLAAAAAAGFLMTAAPMVGALPAKADNLKMAEVDIRVGPGGVRIGDRDRRDRRVCKTVTIRERLPGGGVKIIKRRECRD